MALSTDLSMSHHQSYEVLIYQTLEEVQGKLDELYLEEKVVAYAVQKKGALLLAKRKHLINISKCMSTRPKLSVADYFAAQKESIAQMVRCNELEDAEVELTNLELDQQAIAIAIEEHQATQAALQVELQMLQMAIGQQGKGPQRQESYKEEFDKARGFDVEDDAVFCPQLDDEIAF
ncbi:hypothetical protein PV10_07806 [Exophiala mesophila]|uniref:Uncharacterized protein n=1 Tax=Exophiala mesophila TaxID=212818 RepID=A0A0D1Z6S8_EXOME|nr:uncharacterized protein PV10_07806 [Exophiala mesophila]KIV90507.1 hypothetical protein PV10_07806 [Exophiala mesophila]